MIETELFAQPYKCSYGLATVSYPALEVEARRRTLGQRGRLFLTRCEAGKEEYTLT